jgi:tRNA dimethylallyltransferase
MSAPALAPDATARPVKPIVVVLTGATGVGKTESSLRLAELLNGEIISADSVQVYKGLDVGSDKLPLKERRGLVPSCVSCKM